MEGEGRIQTLLVGTVQHIRLLLRETHNAYTGSEFYKGSRMCLNQTANVAIVAAMGTRTVGSNPTCGLTNPGAETIVTISFAACIQHFGHANK